MTQGRIKRRHRAMKDRLWLEHDRRPGRFQAVIGRFAAYGHLKHPTPTGIFGVLKRNGLSRLPRGAPKRSPSTFKRYEQTVPGHQVQIDVNFLFLRDKANRRIQRYQYTAIDDATRVRALKAYSKHT